MSLYCISIIKNLRKMALICNVFAVCVIWNCFYLFRTPQTKRSHFEREGLESHIYSIKYIGCCLYLHFANFQSSFLGLVVSCAVGLFVQRSNLKSADGEGNWPIHISAQEGYGHMTWSQLCVLGLPAIQVTNKLGYTPYQLANMYDTPRYVFACTC